MKRAIPKSVHGYRALATDGDGTLSRRKELAQRTVAALKWLRGSGRKLILVTGETQKQLQRFPHLELFDIVVAENGAVLYRPETGKATTLTHPPPRSFVRELRRRQVEPTTVGRVIVAVEKPDSKTLQQVIRDLGLVWHIIPNRKQVMALPAGVDKASGLSAALDELRISACDVVAIGDAENDVALLQAAGCGAAVASAVPILRKHANLVTRHGAGRGAVELIEKLFANGPARSGRQRRGKNAVKK